MPRKKKTEDEPLNFGGYLLHNREKLGRVIDGTVGAEGKMAGGLGKEASAEEVIAEYDRLGGLITNIHGEKIETGTFYDFINKKPKDKITLKLAKKPTAGRIKTEEVGDKVKSKKKVKVEEE